MNRGYAGYYKGFYLRSSYEYAYAIYLDYHKVNWTYEAKTFDIGYKIYKPDFFIFDQNGSLLKVVEIKSRNREAKKSAMMALERIKTLHGIDSDLISYEELLNIYEYLPFSLNSVITKWIKSKNTTISKSLSGSLNGHFNIKHTPATKRKIGEHTKQLWNSNSSAKQRMLDGLKKSGLSQKGKIKTPREKRRCLICNSEFITLVSSPKKFCNKVCAGKSAIQNATNIYVNKRKVLHGEIKQFIVEWSIANSSLVLSTPLNKVSTTISSMLDQIENSFGVKDLRVISKAVFGEDRGRKELLLFMKSVCNEKIC